MSRQSPADTTGGRRAALDGKRKGRIVAGVLGVLFGVLFTWYTWVDVPMGTQDRPGAGVYPLAVGIALVVVSLFTIAEAWSTDQIAGEVRLPHGEQGRRALLMAAALIAFIAFYQFLGQYIASSLFMIAALFVLGTRSWVRNVCYGTAVGVGVSAFFMDLLGVRLPQGLLDPGGLIGGLFQ